MIGDDLASAVRVEWTELRAEAVWAGIRPRRRRRVLARLVLVGAAALAGVVALWPRPASVRVAAPVAETRTPAPVAAPAPVPRTEPAPARVTIELPRGARRFDVAGRAYEVRSGRVTVEAFDDEFECARSERATRVEVFRGTVLVRTPGGTRELAAGEHAEIAEPAPRAVRPPPSIDQLLMTADVMRLSHHAEEAIAPLQRIVRDHADDPRAPLAAFTLGRVLLDELARPREAASAFDDAYRLAPGGPLAEDALAREVEAWSRAGDAHAARELAERYLRTFPTGIKARAVRALGGLE